MYGTVARLKFKPGGLEAMREWGETNSEALNAPGHVAFYIYQTDNDPLEGYLVVMFESRDAYHANAASPEQDELFGQMMEFMAAEPEWHDGEIVSSMIYQ